VSEHWGAAERRWAEAAGLLRSAGRAPTDLRDWLGSGWTGRAADGFGSWGRTFEEATRRASGALTDAAAAAGVHASGGQRTFGADHLDRLDDAARAVTGVSIPGQRTAPPKPRAAVPKPRAAAPKKAGQRISGRQPPARVRAWIDEAVQVLREHGYRADQVDPRAIATIIHHESGGNPSAVNHHDSNAARGTPSTGLMQTIGPTFDRYRLPGHGDILHPVDNIIAGARYAVDRYGSVSKVPGLLSLAAGGRYRGY
jgi:soluble lytic murein transglycosylase-like protein